MAREPAFADPHPRGLVAAEDMVRLEIVGSRSLS
jgi:hypothetical protein